MAQIESRSVSMTDGSRARDDKDDEITLSDCIEEGVIDDIRAADLNNMSPFEAMALLHELQKRLK